MSTKRRDNKGRVLLNGEIQEESGRYRYRYNGKENADSRYR
ncbi:integrase DNA-binding domain-containing protein [Roseburia faecis]